MEPTDEKFDWEEQNLGMWIGHTEADKGKSFRISNLRLNSEGDFAQLLMPV